MTIAYRLKELCEALEDKLDYLNEKVGNKSHKIYNTILEAEVDVLEIKTYLLDEIKKHETIEHDKHINSYMRNR